MTTATLPYPHTGNTYYVQGHYVTNLHCQTLKQEGGCEVASEGGRKGDVKWLVKEAGGGM